MQTPRRRLNAIEGGRDEGRTRQQGVNVVSFTVQYLICHSWSYLILKGIYFYSTTLARQNSNASTEGKRNWGQLRWKENMSTGNEWVKFISLHFHPLSNFVVFHRKQHIKGEWATTEGKCLRQTRWVANNAHLWKTHHMILDHGGVRIYWGLGRGPSLLD